jgi:hypothetical protein
MALPATYDEAIEAEVKRFARMALDWFHNLEGNPWSADPILSAEAGHAWLRDLLPRLLGTAFGRMGVIELAKNGYAEAADVLKHFVIELRSNCHELPVELEAYEMEVRARSSDRWPKRPGPNKLDTIVRDLCLMIVVAAVLDRYPHLKATQTSPRNLSACAVVAEAMFGKQWRGRAYNTIKQIWRRRQGAAPTVPGWSHSWFDA